MQGVHHARGLSVSAGAFEPPEQLSGEGYQKKLEEVFDFAAGERILRCLSRETIPCGKDKDPRLSSLFRGNISSSFHDLKQRFNARRACVVPNLNLDTWMRKRAERVLQGHRWRGRGGVHGRPKECMIKLQASGDAR